MANTHAQTKPEPIQSQEKGGYWIPLFLGVLLPFALADSQLPLAYERGEYPLPVLAVILAMDQRKHAGRVMRWWALTPVVTPSRI